MADRETASLAHVDTDETEVWDTPAKPAQRSSNPIGDATSKTNSSRTYEDADSEESALREELASVRKVNEAIEGVIHNLERAQNNIKVGCVAMKLIHRADSLRLSTRRLEPHLPFSTLGHVSCLRPNTISA
jgi:hypothetical protein